MSATASPPRCAWVIAALALAALPADTLAQAPSPDGAGEKAPVNAMCPVMTDEPIDPRFTAEYEGVTVGLCCRKCLTKFQTDPGLYVANIPELMTVSAGNPLEQGAEEQHTDRHAGHDPAPLPEHVEEADHHHESDHPHHDELVAPASSYRGDEHDHATDHDSGSKLVSWIGKLHPPATHLPIGLLIGAAIAEGLLIVTRRGLFKHASAFCVALAAVGAVAAALLGWFNGGFILVDDDWVQLTHRWLGTATALLSLVTLALLVRLSGTSSRTLFRASLSLTTALMLTAGFFGGALVYGLDHYALP